MADFRKFNSMGWGIAKMGNALETYVKVDRVLDQLPAINIKTLEDIPLPKELPWIYRLTSLPNIAILSQLTEQYNSGFSEIGIFCISKRWFLCVPGEEEGSAAVSIPDFFTPILRKGLFTLDFHSHPIITVEKELYALEDATKWVDLVSEADLTFLSNTFTGKIHVGELNGLIVIAQPSQILPGGLDFKDLKFDSQTDVSSSIQLLERSFLEYVKIVAAVNVSDLVERRKIKRDFLQLYFGYRQIPWSEKQTIKHELRS